MDFYIFFRVAVINNRSYIVIYNTAENTVISPDFLVWKFCGKAQFPHTETVPFRKISTPENQVKLRYFPQCKSSQYPLLLFFLQFICFDINTYK